MRDPATLNAAIDQGRTVQVATAFRVTRVTPKARDSWRAAGFEFFKGAADGALLMIEGQTKGKPRYVAVLSSVSVRVI
jgi:hypothetical protein